MLDSYIPNIPDQEWSAIKGFVLAAVTDCDPATPSATRDLLWACTRLARWCRRTAGLDLDRETVLHPATIRDFLANGTEEMTPRSVANLKRLLTRCSERLVPQHARQEPPGPGRVEPAAPYTGTEVAALRAWVYGQPSQARRVQADRLLSLGLGAGLTAAEIAATSVDDLHVDDVGVLISVRGPRTREVPVLADWSGPLKQVAENPNCTGYVLLPSRKRIRNLISNFANSGSGEPGPNSHRMRSTWIVRHLIAGVPVRGLLKAAGIETVQGLTKFLTHVPAPDVDAVRRALHGAHEGR